MFSIYGGAAEFKQWTKGKMVENPNMTDCEEVVFRMSNGNVGVSLAYEHEGTMVADVPNHVLKCAGNMLVELGQNEDLRAEESTTFVVVAAEKPESYVCTMNRNMEKKNVLTTKQNLTEAEKAQVRENIGVEGGSGGGDCDWNIMKNKPFGEEKLTKTNTLFEETITNGESGASVQLAWYEGDTVNCCVEFDGEEYWFINKIQCEDNIGDPNLVEYPFYVEQEFLGGAAGCDGKVKCIAGEHTVKVSAVEVVPGTLPSEYLPKLHDVCSIYYDEETPTSIEEVADAFNTLYAALDAAGYLG